MASEPVSSRERKVRIVVITSTVALASSLVLSWLVPDALLPVVVVGIAFLGIGYIIGWPNLGSTRLPTRFPWYLLFVVAGGLIILGAWLSTFIPRVG